MLWNKGMHYNIGNSVIFRHFFALTSCLLLFLSFSVNAEPEIRTDRQDTYADTQWYVIAPSTKSIYKKQYQLITEGLTKQNFSFLTVSDIQNCQFPEKHFKIITIGILALKQVARCQLKSTIFGYFFTEYQFQALNVKLKDSLNQANLLFADQPLIHQVALAMQLKPELKNIGVLYSPGIANQIQLLEKHLPQSITLNSKLIPDGDYFLNLINLIKNSDIFIAPYDSDIFNSKNAKTILLTSYRHDKAIVGNSRGFVRAGIVASCISTPEILVRTLIQTIKKSHNVKSLRSYSSDFEITVNKEVAHSLNLKNFSADNLKQRVYNQLRKWKVEL